MANQIFHYSNTGISSGQRFYLKDDVSGIFLDKLNVNVTSGNLTVSGNLNVAGSVNINGISVNPYQPEFPAWTGIRRYAPLDLLSVANQVITTGSINYFPFLIKKKVVNPIACVDMNLYSTFDPKIVIGIYSGHYGFENAKLIASGSITGDILNTGIYRTRLNGTFDQGPYILASMLETGAGSQFRIVGSHGFREHFGINTGVNILQGLNSTVLTNILAETGQVNLKQNIGSGSWFATAASVVSPVVFLEY